MATEGLMDISTRESVVLPPIPVLAVDLDPNL
jgi:hypothetical protein